MEFWIVVVQNTQVFKQSNIQTIKHLDTYARFLLIIVKQFALDMRNAFPDAKGFSYSNVKDMKRWYLFYYEQVSKGQHAVGLLENHSAQQPNDKLRVIKGHQVGGQIEVTEKSHQLGGLLEMPEIFGHVPWKHHVYIVSKSKTLEEALFYIGRVAEEGWSRSWLEDQIANKLYRNQGAAFFFKQWGTWGSDGVKRNKHANGKLLFGEVIQQMPEKVAV